MYEKSGLISKPYPQNSDTQSHEYNTITTRHPINMKSMPYKNQLLFVNHIEKHTIGFLETLLTHLLESIIVI